MEIMGYIKSLKRFDKHCHIDISLILITKLVFSYKLLIIGILINEYYKINKYYI